MNSREKTTILEGEAVTYIPLSELHPFPNHPFKVRDDDAMSEMTESIMEYGILTPAIVRPRDEGGYLKPEEQQMVTDAIAKGHSTPSLVQAQQLKKISRSGGLDTEALRSVMTEGKKPKRSAPARAKPVTPPQEDTLPPPPQDTPPEPPPFQLGGKSFATIQESVQDLKNMDKDCSCTPDIFLAAITEFVKRFQSEISCYADEYYAPVFPALSPVQLRYLRQQMDTIRNAADQLYILIEGKIENE